MRQPTQRIPQHHIEFHRRRRAKPVDEQRDTLPIDQFQIVNDAAKDGIHQARRIRHRSTLHARLAMDAKTVLDLVVTQLKPGVPHGRHRTRPQGNPHRTEPTNGAAGEGSHLVQRLPSCCRRTGHFVHQHRPGDAATTIGRHRIPQRDIVRHGHHLDRRTFGPGDLSGQPEVEPVARIVLHYQHGTRRAGHAAQPRQHGVDTGRGKDIPRDSGRQQPFADITGMRRLMATSPAGKNGNLPGAIGTPPHHHVLGIE
ncbi:hypothetical protein KCV01_g7291, partial [Aureobasidium melanogenum]